MSVVKDFRLILKHLRRLPSGDSSSKAMYQHVMSMFNAGRQETDKVKIKHMRSIAHSYATTIESVNELIFLRSLDTGDKLEQNELVKLMGSKVGFAMPKEYDENDAENTGRDSERMKRLIKETESN